MMCILAYLLKCWWHACLHLCQWYPGPCFPYCCPGITSLLCTGVGQVCIQCIPYTRECTTWCTVTAGTRWPQPFRLLPPMACSCNNIYYFCVALAFCCILNSGTDSLIQNMFWLQKTSFQALWALHQVWPDEELRDLESLSFAIKTCSV